MIWQSSALLIAEFYLTCKIKCIYSSQFDWYKNFVPVLICVEMDMDRSARSVHPMNSGMELSSVIPVPPSCDHCSLVSVFTWNAVRKSVLAH